MKRSMCLPAVLLAVLCGASPALAKSSKPPSPKRVNNAARAALAAMEAAATQRHIQGVAVVAFAPAAPGDPITRWSSAMEVVGHMTDHTNGDKGNNLLAIAYAKASEMADTLKDSGTAGAPPMTGEFGWQGGVLARTSSGYLIAAFSGGKSEDDVATSRVGLAVLKSRL